MNIRVASLLATATLLSACGPEFAYHRDPTVPIPAGATWSWGIPDGDGLAPHDGAMTPPDSIARLIASAIENELASAGFPRAYGDSAQFVVHYHVGQREVVSTLPRSDDPSTSTGGIRPPGTWGGYGRPEELEDQLVRWDEGMLIVDFLPRDRRVVAWRGAIVGELPSKARRNAGPVLREAIRRLMRGFP